MPRRLLLTIFLLLASSTLYAATDNTGPVAGDMSGHSAASAKKSAGQTWTININHADIRAFVSQVADMTGKNFVLDPRVRAKDVTVVSRKALTKKEVYQLFLAVLQVNGYAAIPSGNVVKIVPNTTAKSYDLPMAKSNKDGQSLVTEVLPLHKLPATQLVPVLRPLVPQYGHLAAVASANALVISDHEDNIQRINSIITRLENGGSSGISVIQLKNAWVGDIVKQLQSLIPQAGAGGKGRSKKGAQTVMVADERTNRLLVRGDPKVRHQIKSLVSQLDVPGSQEGNIQVVRLNHGDAKDIAKLLNQFFGGETGGKGKTGNPDAKVSIQADESLNALVVQADAGKMKELRSIIHDLDVRRAQVLIEAAIVEVSADKAQDLGVQWAAGDVDTGVGGTNFSGNGLSVNNVLGAIVGSKTGTASSVPQLADGVTAGFGEIDSNGRVKWAGLVQALASNSSVNLLSTPSVLTLDNQEASIMVGKNVPFVTGRYTNTNNSVSNPFQTIQREDVGITLKVTPHLGKADSLRLELDQEVSSVQQGSSSANGLTTNKREIKTTVLADDGQTIVLGGLIQDNIKKSVSKVPILGSIPLLGALFRSTHNSHERSNLIVFLRPTIVHDNDKLVSLTRNKYLGVVSLQFRLNNRGELERVVKKPLPLQVNDVFEGRQPPSDDLKAAFRKREGAQRSASDKDGDNQTDAKQQANQTAASKPQADDAAADSKADKDNNATE